MRRFPKQARYAAAAALAILIGTGIFAQAARPGSIGSLFYLPLVDGVPSTPCNSDTVKGLTTTTCNAVVDSRGQLAVSDTDTHASLGRFKFDPNGNLQTSGNLNVTNFPVNQQVNFGGAAQPVTVQNFPSSPVANRGFGLDEPGQSPGSTHSFTVVMKVSFLHMESSDDTTVFFGLPSVGRFAVLHLNGESREITFTQAVQINFIDVRCNTVFTKCTYHLSAFGSPAS